MKAKIVLFPSEDRDLLQLQYRSIKVSCPYSEYEILTPTLDGRLPDQARQLQMTAVTVGDLNYSTICNEVILNREERSGTITIMLPPSVIFLAPSWIDLLLGSFAENPNICIGSGVFEPILSSGEEIEYPSIDGPLVIRDEFYRDNDGLPAEVESWGVGLLLFLQFSSRKGSSIYIPQDWFHKYPFVTSIAPIWSKENDLSRALDFFQGGKENEDGPI